MAHASAEHLVRRIHFVTGLAAIASWMAAIVSFGFAEARDVRGVCFVAALVFAVAYALTFRRRER